MSLKYEPASEPLHISVTRRARFGSTGLTPDRRPILPNCRSILPNCRPILLNRSPVMSNCCPILPIAALSWQPPPYPANRRPILPTATLSWQPPPYPANRTWNAAGLKLVSRALDRFNSGSQQNLKAILRLAKLNMRVNMIF